MAYVSESPRVASGHFQGLFSRLIPSVKTSVLRRVSYLRTLDALERMNDRDLADLGLSGRPLRDIARDAAERAIAS